MNVLHEDIYAYARRLYGRRGSLAHREAVAMAESYESIGDRERHDAWLNVAECVHTLISQPDLR